MSSTLKQILLWVVGILILLILLAWLVKGCNESQQNQNKVIPSLPIKTDTIYVPHYLPDTINAQQVNIIPNMVVKPLNQNGYDTIPDVQYLHDTVTITLGDSSKVTYDSRFLTNFKSSSKLVSASFTKDTIQLYLINPDGTQSALVYKSFYNSYKYLYFNNSLHQIPISVPTTTSLGSVPWNKNISTEANAALLFSPITEKPALMVDYSMMYKQKIGLTSLISYTVGQTPEFQAFIGVRYKLK